VIWSAWTWVSIAKTKSQAQLFQRSEIPFDVFEYRIDDDRLAGIAVGHDVGPALRPIVDVLHLVHVQQHGDAIRDSHGMRSATPYKNCGAILLFLGSLVHR